MKTKKAIKTEATFKFWVTIPDRSIATAVKNVFLDSLNKNGLELSWQPSDITIDASKGLITIQSEIPDINADDSEFIYHLPQDWNIAINKVKEDIRKLKLLGVAFN